MSSASNIELAGLELSGNFPFMNAPGSINGAGEEGFRLEFMDYVRAPGTIAMVGSVTIPYKEGNIAKYGGPVYQHIESTGATYNSMGLPNLGIERYEQILPELAVIAHDHDKKLGVSLAPISDNPGAEWNQMIERVMEKGVDIIELNAGCPNVYNENNEPKTVLSLVPEALGVALEQVQSRFGQHLTSPIFGVKLSPAPVSDFRNPEFNEKIIQKQAEAINYLGLYGYVAYANTFGGQVPIDENNIELPLSVPGGGGGVSGPIVADVMNDQTEVFMSYLNEDIDVVASGGISSGEELNKRLSIDSRVKIGSSVTALWKAPSIGAGATKIAEEYSRIAG